MFKEDETTEQLIISSLKDNGWTYIPSDQLSREYSDAFVGSMVKSALIRLNPVIAEDENKANEVIFKLRALFLSTNSQNLVTQNELFKQLVFEKNSFPFGKDGKQISIDFFGTEVNGKLNQNEYVVTNQWVYPQKDKGKRLDIVLLINGFPVVIGEVKTPTRAAITWLDGAEDINNYEKVYLLCLCQIFLTLLQKGNIIVMGQYACRPPNGVPGIRLMINLMEVWQLCGTV